MRSYTQLTQEQRYQIYTFLKTGFSPSTIAFEIDVHKSTVSREIKRNLGKKDYRPKQAHVMAITRRHRADKFVKMTLQLIAIIDNLIRTFGMIKNIIADNKIKDLI